MTAARPGGPLSQSPKQFNYLSRPFPRVILLVFSFSGSAMPLAHDHHCASRSVERLGGILMAPICDAIAITFSVPSLVRRNDPKTIHVKP